uniref:Gelsolin-related protein of 125 kDa n=1 Tax=Daphnia magna TaxID=35525 RepID=A0A0P6ED96_9CRUS
MTWIATGDLPIGISRHQITHHLVMLQEISIATTIAEAKAMKSLILVGQAKEVPILHLRNMKDIHHLREVLKEDMNIQENIKNRTAIMVMTKNLSESINVLMGATVLIEQDGDGLEKVIKIEMEQEQAIDESKITDEDQLSRTAEPGKKPETERSPKRKGTSKEFPEHFIKLQCPHCNQRSVTFREYILHLSSPRHEKSLEKISLQHRMSLAKLRTRQRKEQLQIEAQTSRSSHKSQMNFCAICKLCHSESRPNHEITELHKIIKNFLMPYCPICRVNFKSRMLYEKHVATLPHIKNKVNMEKSYERRREEERKHERDGFEKDEVILDLENFMTLDAVGSVDGDNDNGMSLEETAVGQECVKKVEAFFCDLCQRYLSRVEPLEKGLEFHCRTRSHHRAYEERQNSHKELEGGAEVRKSYNMLVNRNKSLFQFQIV